MSCTRLLTVKKTYSMDIVETARLYAIKCHADTNHFYDYEGQPYEYHLSYVAQVAARYIQLVPEELRQDILAACWTHDVIEDCRQTYNDVKKATNERVAELTYAVTNEKGKTRDERANFKYYEDMCQVPGARFIKICDRIANMEYSVSTGSSMADDYRKELKDFHSHVFSVQYLPMLNHLKSL